MEKEKCIIKNSEKEKLELLKEIFRINNKKINVLITGATGSGKSSTINALFDYEISKVGYGVNPETMEIEKFELENLVLWDSPGLGDGLKEDIVHSKNIINKLTELDKEGNALIDLVLVIIDGSSRDMGTSYKLINEIIIPNMKNTERILVAINQADFAMKGKNFNYESNSPNQRLKTFLDEKRTSIRERINKNYSIDIPVVCYSAETGYNMEKLLDTLILNIPREKRQIINKV